MATADLGALQAAANGGKAGLAVYQQQRQADIAAADAAVSMLMGGHYGLADESAIRGTIGQTNGRTLSRLGSQETGAVARQGTLAGVPAYLQRHADLQAAAGPWQAAQTAAAAGTHNYETGIAAEAAARFKAEEAAKQFSFDQEQWNKRFRLAHPGTTAV